MTQIATLLFETGLSSGSSRWCAIRFLCRIEFCRNTAVRIGGTVIYNLAKKNILANFQGCNDAGGGVQNIS